MTFCVECRHLLAYTEHCGFLCPNADCERSPNFLRMPNPGQPLVADPLHLEQVDHPKHYNMHPTGVECIDIIEHMTFNIGNAIKYCWRSGLKEGTPSVLDLRKARWYIDREIERLDGKPGQP